MRNRQLRPDCAICGEENNCFASETCSVCWEAKHAIQMRAVHTVRRAVKAGRIPDARQHKCMDCDRQATDYDHREYSKPLDVQPVCRGCNIRRGHALDLYALVRSRLQLTA